MSTDLVAYGTTTAIAIAGLTIAIIALCDRPGNVDTSDFLKIDGTNHMNANLNMGHHTFTDLSVFTLETITVSPSLPPSGSTQFFSTGGGNLTQIDEFGTEYTYLTTIPPTGDFLPRDGSKPMLGHLDMGTNNLLNLVSIATPVTNNNVVFGSGTTLTQPTNQSNILIGVNHSATGLQDILVGYNSSVTGGNQNAVVGTTHAIVGDSNACFGSNTNQITGNNNNVLGLGNFLTGGQTLIFGNDNTVNSGTSLSCIVGTANTVNTNVFNGGIVGFSNVIGQNNCFIIGNQATNNNVNTICLGAGLTSVYPFNDNAMSVGTSSQRFLNTYLTNNVYINSLPVPIAQYSSAAPFTISNTITETVYSGTSHLGNLTLPPLQVGAVIRVTVNFIVTLASTASGDGLHLYLNNASASTKLSSPFLTLPTNTALSNVVGTVTYTLVVRDSANLFETAFCSMITPSVPNNGSQALVAYPSTTSQTLSLSAQFDIGVNVQFTAEQIFIETLFKTA